MNIVEVGLDYLGSVKQWIDSYPASYVSLASAATVAAFAPLKRIVTEKIINPYMEVRWARLRSWWIGDMPAGEAPLGKVSSHVVIIHGTPAEVIRNAGGKPRIDKQVKILFRDNPVKLSKKVEIEVGIIESEKNNPEKHHGKALWNGPFINITRFDAAKRDVEDEASLLTIDVVPATYFEFMATAAKIDHELKENNYDLAKCKIRNELIQGFDTPQEWRQKVCRSIVNGLPINFLVKTSDGYLVFAKRGHAVAIAPNQVACAVNENISLADKKDGSSSNPELSVEKLIKRGFSEELGIRLDELDQNDVEINLISFVVNALTGGHGLLGYVSLAKMNFSELKVNFDALTKDRMETSELIGVKMTSKDVAAFIVKEQLYNLVGVCAVLVLLSQPNPPTLEKVQAQIRRLQ